MCHMSQHWIMFAFTGLLTEEELSFSNAYIGTSNIYLSNMKVESKGCHMLARKPKISTALLWS